MNRAFLICVSIIALLALSPVPDSAWGQSAKGKGKGPSQQPPAKQSTLKDAEKTAAAFRKSQGLPRYTINDDRWVSAQTNANARAAALRNAKGGAQ